MCVYKYKLDHDLVTVGAINFRFLIILVEWLFWFRFESGFVTDQEVERRESTLRALLDKDPEFCVKDGASVEVAQVYFYKWTIPNKA